jgi:enamine deaminase RidA (YjgF/YER057c/UK114 family)
LTLIETPDAPPCNGHYSQAVVARGLVFLSNQLPLIPGTPGLLPEGMEAQVRQIIVEFSIIWPNISTFCHSIRSRTWGAAKEGNFTYDSGSAPSRKSGCCHFARALPS